MNALKLMPRLNKELLSLYIVFAVLLIINIILDPTIFSISRLSTLALQFMPLILVAMAQGVIMLTGGIDLSVGSSLSLMTAVTAVVMSDSGFGIAIAIITTILVGMIVGVITGTIVSVGRLPAIIVTLATSYIWHGLALFILPTPGGNIPATFTQWMLRSSVISSGIIFIGIAILIWIYVKNTSVGINIYAVGDSERAAFVSGIKVNRTRIFAYMLAGLFMALAGIGLSGQIGSGDPNIGTPYTLNSITAAVLGGIAFFGGQGKLRGAI